MVWRGHWSRTFRWFIQPMPTFLKIYIKRSKRLYLSAHSTHMPTSKYLSAHSTHMPTSKYLSAHSTHAHIKVFISTFYSCPHQSIYQHILLISPHQSIYPRVILISHIIIIIPAPSWSYGSWIYNYLCNQCYRAPLKLWVRIPLMARCTWCNIMW